jgi:outer membrane protein assembly factor BamA
VTRGPIVTVHRIEIRGNSKTSERVIRREMQVIEGERYSESSYQASRRRIMALGFFERVDLSTEPLPGHPDRLVVNVEVAERPTGTFQIGAGFSSVENFIATAQIQQLNLFGRGQSLTLQAQLSGFDRSSRCASSSRTSSTPTGPSRSTCTTASGPSRTSPARAPAAPSPSGTPSSATTCGCL